MAQLDFESGGPTSYFYEDAFGQEVRVLWEKVFPGELRDLCYRALLSAFRHSSEANVVDRQSALYHLLRGPFAWDKDSDPLNQYRKLLPVRNWVTKVLDQLCMGYNNDPTRQFSSSDSINRFLSRCYREARMNVELRWAHQQATLHNYVLVRPYFDWKRRMRVQTLLPDVFRIKWHPEDFGRIAELWIVTSQPSADKQGAGEIIFQVWTDTQYWWTDIYGHQVGEVQINNYGTIPFVPLQMTSSRSSDDPFGGGLYPLVYANLIDNALAWSGLNSVLFNSFSVWVSTNMEWGDGRARLHPGKLIAVEKASKGSDVNPKLPPNLEAIGSDGQYTMIDEYRQQQKEDELFDLGLPDFLASRKGGLPTTATEQLIKYTGLLEKRKADLPVLDEFERTLAEMVCLVAYVDIGERGLPLTLPDMSVDFADLRLVQEPEKELAFDAQLVATGLMRIETFVQKWEGADEALTEEEAIETITSRAEKYADVIKILKTVKVFGIGASGPAPTPPGMEQPSQQPGQQQPHNAPPVTAGGSPTLPPQPNPLEVP